MNKEKFLSELKRKLSRLPQNELDNAINYYTEYFQDANIGDDVDVTLELGTPSQIASELLAEYATKNTIDEKKGGKNPISSIWFIILAIFAAPIGIPLAFAAIITIAALLFAGVMVVFAFGITAVAFSFSGIVMFVAALTILFKEFSTSLLVGGLGFIFTGLGALVAIGIVYLFNGLIKLIVSLSKRFLKNSSKKVRGSRR